MAYKKRKVNYRATRPRKVQYQRQENLVTDFLTYEIDRPEFTTELAGFSAFFLSNVANATVNLARVGVGVAKRALIGAETPWGQARMRGEYFGVSFRPYGKGPGRFASGNMFNALKILDANAGNFGGSKKSNLRVLWGYDKKMDRSKKNGSPYFEDQERGFLNALAFDPNRTRADGEARFKRAASPRRVKGARALEAGMERIGDRADVYYSRAWEIAKERFESKGFSTSGVGTFIDAKKAYKKPKRGNISNYDGVLGRLVQGDSEPLQFGGPLSDRQYEAMMDQVNRNVSSFFKI